MLDAQADQTARRQLAVTVVDAKTRKDLSWQQLADAAGLSVAFTAAALLSAGTRCPPPRRRPSSSCCA
jgi:cyanate lyase